MKIVLVPLWIASLAGAFYFGSRVGVREFSLADAQYRAAITAGDLRLIDKSRTSELQAVLQVQLDSALSDYADYQDSSWKWLWPAMQQNDLHSIVFAANYRACHSHKWPELHFASDTPADFVEQIKEGGEELQKKVRRIVGEFTHQDTRQCPTDQPQVSPGSSG